MADLVFIAFDSEEKAEEVRKKILDMQKEYLIEVDDAVIATRDANGKINLNQLTNTTAQGALGGALTDYGIDDNQMRADAQAALAPGKAGLFLLIRKVTTDKVLEELRGVGGTVIRTSFDHAKDEALKAALAAAPAPEPVEAPKA